MQQHLLVKPPTKEWPSVVEWQVDDKGNNNFCSQQSLLWCNVMSSHEKQFFLCHREFYSHAITGLNIIFVIFLNFVFGF